MFNLIMTLRNAQVPSNVCIEQIPQMWNYTAHAH